VQIATGNIVQDDVTLGESVTRSDVLIHNAITDATPLFFEVPEKVLPPGRYNVTVLLKVSDLTANKVITLDALKGPEQSKLVTKTIWGSDFNRAGTWQAFTFNFSLEQPTFIKIDADVTNSTDVYFYSINVLQVSGGG
jgi:hypothetical protein